MKTAKIRKSIYLSVEYAKKIEEYADQNGFSESMVYTLAVKRLLDNGMVIEMIKSIQNNKKIQ